MKASYITRYGKSSPLIHGDVPDPVMKDNELLVEIRAVSVNPVDYKIRSGIIRIITGFRFPMILGTDYAGIVKDTGKETAGFKQGDRVYGSSSVIFGNSGKLAGLLATPVKYARHIPDGMSFEEAASLPVAALTGLNGLRKGGIDSGKSVFINGASGGVGHFAVQIAKARGAHVTASCSPSNHSFVKSLGADEVCGYTDNDYAAIKWKFDSIADAYGAMKYKHIIPLLKKKGVYTSTLFFPPRSVTAPVIGMISNIKLTSANMRSQPGDYLELENLFRDGKLKPFIGKTFPLEMANEAFAYAENGKPRGKVVITV